MPMVSSTSLDSEVHRQHQATINQNSKKHSKPKQVKENNNVQTMDEVVERQGLEDDAIHQEERYSDCELDDNLRVHVSVHYRRAAEQQGNSADLGGTCEQERHQTDVPVTSQPQTGEVMDLFGMLRVQQLLPRAFDRTHHKGL